MIDFGLIICTYKRPLAVRRLLESIEDQSFYPGEIVVVDGSPDDSTKQILHERIFKDLKYFPVAKKDLGLTKQRNYGLSQISADLEVVCFLDDDVLLKPDFFENLLNTYYNYPNALGVGGYIIDNTIDWRRADGAIKTEEYEIDGWVRPLGSRNALRRKLGLLSNLPPGFMPQASNGLSIGFLPPSGQTYPVEFFMGGVASYRTEVFKYNRFSSYFEGYGLYEDMDFCLRASKMGQLYVNTSARLYHYHEDSGRPNRFEYGKMVIRNGWYVWRVKYPSPGLKARLKWNATALLLTLVRLGNAVNTPKRIEALTESTGRIIGWCSLLFDKPKHES
ncbi:glycosyltransferase family 2 protein [Salinimicrobium soli]|uniref:glycosyltransferase family 2 protein n=1 Tax=Salinimicrobium soli TaxID=1254399 RepID=UPI003AAC1900